MRSEIFDCILPVFEFEEISSSWFLLHELPHEPSLAFLAPQRVSPLTSMEAFVVLGHD